MRVSNRITLKREYYINHIYYYIWYFKYNTADIKNHAALGNHAGDYFYYNSIFWKKNILYNEEFYNNYSAIYLISG